MAAKQAHTSSQPTEPSPECPAVIDLIEPSAAAARLTAPVANGRTWLARDLDPDEIVVRLGGDTRAELLALAGAIAADPLPILLRRPAQFSMPWLTAVMRAVKQRLDDGPGLAVVDGVPLDEVDAEMAKAAFWVLGQAIGQPVAQKWDGTMLYDVTDTGAAYDYGVRGSWTNVELGFHTDNAFGLAPPDAVGLMCLYPALEGGTSRFCSLYQVHNRLLADHPAALERLYGPMLWDRQAEHAAGAPRVSRGPMFRFDGRRLSVRANVSLVRTGHAVAGSPMDAPLSDALDVLETVTADPALWFELPLERGHLQYLNNREIAHYRSPFTDQPDGTKKRHLVRTWHRDWGGPTYDG